MPRPLTYLSFALMAGIITGYFTIIPSLPLLIMLFFIFILLLIAVRKKVKTLALPLAALAIFITGILNINHSLYITPDDKHIIYRITDEKLTVEGIIDETPEESPEGTRVVVSTRRIMRGDQIVPTAGRALLMIRVDYPLKYGDLIRFRSRLRRPRNFHNPGSFDYEKQLRGRGILVQGTINNDSDIILIREGQGNRLKLEVEKARSKLRQIIAENSVTPGRELIQALLLGERRQIPPQLRENFNRTGTSHILAISGFHVAMVASFAIFLTMLVMKSSPYLLLRFNALRVSAALSLIPIVIYAFIAGFGVSVIRATIMILAFLAAILLNKERDLFNTLALAAIIILLVSPQALFDISFQLSFVAVASLIFVSPLLASFIPERPAEGMAAPVPFMRRIVNCLVMFVFVTLSATMGSMPLIVYYFNGFPTLTLPANCIIVPLLGMIALTLGMAVIITLPISQALSALLVKLASIPAELSVSAVNFFASLPGSQVIMSTPTLLEIICFYLVLITIVTIIRKKREAKATEAGGAAKLPLFLKLAFFLLILFFAADILYLTFRDRFRQVLLVTAIDVGQGSSTLIRLPAGKDILIDGGGSAAGSFDMGKYVLAPYLWRERIKKLDLVILTHPHPDHLQGLLFVAEKFAIGEVWTNGQSDGSELQANFLRILREKGIPQRIVGKESPPLTLNGVTIKVLNPGKSWLSGPFQKNNFQAVNDSSLVVRLAFGKTSFLFPGDISGAIERRLLDEGAEIKSDVLFVAHHGGFSSSTEPFLRTVRPRLAVISCGQDNIFKLPHPDVVRRLDALPAQLYRTDINGAVSISTEGRGLRVTTVRGKRSDEQ